MEKGDVFPEFVLPDENGETVDSKQLLGLRYVVFFYSRDNTPGCTAEAVDFTKLYANFAMRNVLIFGISRDSAESHRKFKSRYGLKEKLLSDTDHSFAEKCGAYGDKISYGKQVKGTIRSTFLVGKNGKIEEMWTNVKVTGHAQKVLDAMLIHFKSDTGSNIPFDGNI